MPKWILLAFGVSLSLPASGAGFSQHNSYRLAQALNAVGLFQQYFSRKAANYTLKGLEASTGHRLNTTERRFFRLMLAAREQEITNPTLEKSKKLGKIAMWTAIAGAIMLFIPAVQVVSVFVLGAALVLGLWARKLQKQALQEMEIRPGKEKPDENFKNRGNTAITIVGTALATLFIGLIILVSQL